MRVSVWAPTKLFFKLKIFIMYNSQYDIMKVWMGKTLMDWCDSIMKERIKTTKDKRIRHLKEPYRSSQYSWDCLQSQPREAKEDIDHMLLEDID